MSRRIADPGTRARADRPQRGLLFFEVCVAMAIMAIAVVWMLRSFSQTILAIETARDYSLALQLLDERALYAWVQGGVPLTGEQGTAADPAWQWNITVTPQRNTASQLLLTQFTIQWMQGQRPHSLTAATWLPASQ